MNKHAHPSNGGVTTVRLMLTWLPIGTIITVVGYYFAFLFEHAINVPLADDIFDVVQVITCYRRRRV